MRQISGDGRRQRRRRTTTARIERERGGGEFGQAPTRLHSGGVAQLGCRAKTGPKSLAMCARLEGHRCLPPTGPRIVPGLARHPLRAPLPHVGAGKHCCANALEAAAGALPARSAGDLHMWRANKAAMAQFQFRRKKQPALPKTPHRERRRSGGGSRARWEVWQRAPPGDAPRGSRASWSLRCRRRRGPPPKSRASSAASASAGGPRPPCTAAPRRG